MSSDAEDCLEQARYLDKWCGFWPSLTGSIVDRARFDLAIDTKFGSRLGAEGMTSVLVPSRKLGLSIK